MKVETNVWASKTPFLIASQEEKKEIGTLQKASTCNFPLVK